MSNKLPSYKQVRISHDDGTWSDVSTVEFSADSLSFKDIVLEDYETRLQDIAQLRYVKALLRGEANPIIVTWACLEHDTTCADLFPSLNTITDDGEYLISANSLITYTMRTILERHWLFYETKAWQLDIPSDEKVWQNCATTILDWLIENNRLQLKTTAHDISRQDFVGFQAQLNAIPVGQCGFVRREVQKKRYQIAFNTSYFLLEHDDFTSHHSALGEAYNLFVSDGDILRPPLYSRSAIWRDADSSWHIDRIGMQDIKICLSDFISLSHESSKEQATDFAFVLNAENSETPIVYTRYFGVETHGTVFGYTPLSEERLEFTVIGTEIVGWKIGGNLLIPQNGFIISFAPNQLSNTQVQNILNGRQVTYHLLGKFQNIREAIQCGPRLLAAEELALDDNIFEQESFWVSREKENRKIIGVVPTDYPIDIDTVRAGRMGIGIKADGNLVVVAVSGVNYGYSLNNTDSNGATLVELASYLKAAGAVNAMNLDGGGSTQLFVEGGTLTRFGDRRGSPGLVFERMIPSVGVVL